MSTATVQPIRAVVTHWVDVRDHLPADDRNVLCYAPEQTPPVWPGYYDEQESCWYNSEGWQMDSVQDWAEMPPAPENKP